MNNGKICVSVCAKNADELIEQIKRAEEDADLIEIRFDCLFESEFDSALRKVDECKCTKPFIATLRPKQVWAMLGFRIGRNATDEQKKQWLEAVKFRIYGWEKISALSNVEFVDFDGDLQMGFSSYYLEKSPEAESAYVFSKEVDSKLLEKQVIFSEHDYEKIPKYFDEIYDGMLTEENDGIQADIIKIAVQADDITDTIPVWKLLKRARSENQEIIPIAMGEAGKWTRILGPAHGAFLTFASLDTESATAPGQVTIQDLREVYRVKELNAETDVYGIIGGNTSYSMSPYIHNPAFKFHHLNAVFVPLQVQNLDEFIIRMVKSATREVELNFKGFSVTIPHKQSVIKHLDFIDETAKFIGAVNTVKITDGKIHGFNTDADGFIKPLKSAYGDLRDAKALVFGTGGASLACVYALRKEGAEVSVFSSREIQDSRFRIQNFSEFDIIVNATPLGMSGKFEGETPAVAEQLKGVKLVYDLVYIPQETELIKQAKSVGIKTLGGLEMLVAQGMKQFEIWTGKEAPMKEISAEVLRRLQ